MSVDQLEKLTRLPFLKRKEHKSAIIQLELLLNACHAELNEYHDSKVGVETYLDEWIDKQIEYHENMLSHLRASKSS